MKPDPMRNLDFYNPEKDKNNVLVVGAGHIGSYVVFGLARMGVKNITVVDPDYVEAHNLPNQFFAEELLKNANDDTKIFKVFALKSTIEYMVKNISLEVYPEKIEQCEAIKGKFFHVVISAVDDMDVRRWLWDEYKGKANVFIDGRTGGEFANIYHIVLTDTKARDVYEKSLHSNAVAAPLPCTGTAVIDVCFCVAGEIIQRYRKSTLGQKHAIWTFHDYKVVGCGYMESYPKLNNDDDEPIRDENFVKSIGADVVSDATDAPATLREVEYLEDEFDEIYDEDEDEESEEEDE